MDTIVLAVFGLVYLGMLLGEIPGLALDRTGVALLGALALVATANVTNWWTVRTAAARSGGAHVQPIFQPVRLNVFPAEEMVTVRSRMPGSEAIGTWAPSKTMCS